jgi:hypothetical protein
MRSNANLTKRLARIEAGRRTGAPTLLFSDRPMDDLEADALANWEHLVAEGEASVRNGVLYLAGPKMTVEDWVARYVAED